MEVHKEKVMKIQKHGEGEKRRFMEIGFDETFWDARDYNRENPMMKCTLCDDIDDIDDDIKPNAVDLSDGYLYHYRDDEEVIPFVAKVVIE